MQKQKSPFKTPLKWGIMNFVWLEWLDTLIFLNEWEKASSVGQQAKEFYPDQIELDFRIAGCFQKLGKVLKWNTTFKMSHSTAMI